MEKKAENFARSTTAWAKPLVLGAALSALGCSSMTMDANSPLDSAPPDTARMYFVLNQGWPGGEAYVLEDEELIGHVTNEEFFVVDVPAGEHQWLMISQNDQGLEGTVEAGKTYYVRMFITPGVFGTHVYWTPMEPEGEDFEEFIEEMDDSQRVELVPEKAAKWEANEKEDIQERWESFESGEDEMKTLGPEHAK